MVRIHPDRPVGSADSQTRGSSVESPQFIPDGKVGLNSKQVSKEDSPLMFIENRIKEKEMS